MLSTAPKIRTNVEREKTNIYHEIRVAFDLVFFSLFLSIVVMFSELK